MIQKELFGVSVENIQADQTDVTHESRMIVEQLCRINVDMAHEIVPRWAQEIVATEGQRREMEHSIKKIQDIVATLEKAMMHLQASMNHLDTDTATDYLAKIAESILPEELTIPEDWEVIVKPSDKNGRTTAIVASAKAFALRLPTISAHLISSIVHRMDQLRVPIIKKKLSTSSLQVLSVSPANPVFSTSITNMELDDMRVSEITSILFILDYNLELFREWLAEMKQQSNELMVQLLQLICSLEPDHMKIFKNIVQEKYLEEGMFLSVRKFPRSPDSFIQ